MSTVPELLDALEHRSMLFSPSLIKRAFAVWGHMIIANAIVTGLLVAGMLALSFALGLLAGAFVK